MTNTDHVVPTIIETMADAELFQPWFAGPSWDAWRVALKGAYALQMTKAERKVFRVLAGREPPRKPVREFWNVCGRRAGKDSIASLMGAHTAAFFDPRGKLRRGERASVLCLAVDREQAGIILGYIKAYFSDIPYLRQMVTNETATGLELSNGVDIVVATNDFRSVRGRAVAQATFDECAFWRDDRSAAPDVETYRAVLPGTVTVGGMIIGISSPHKKSGLLYSKWREHYGRDDGDVLVIRAPSLLMNPTLDRKLIETEIERDPAFGKSEWLAEWRDDLATFLDRALIEAAVDVGVMVRPRVPNVKYHCMIDPSGGVGDSMTLGIAHRENDVVVLDCMIERPAPFKAQQVVSDFVKVMREFGLKTCTSDRYAASWVSQSFAAHGIAVRHSARDRSQIYSDVLPIFTSGKARLLDNKRLISQFAALERKTTATRDKIDHPQHGGKDDVSNSAAGAMVLANDRRNEVPIFGGWGVVTSADLRGLSPVENWTAARGYSDPGRSH
jgi:hypothetical protein